MKKLLLPILSTIFVLFLGLNSAFADNQSDILAVFDKYVEAANNYSTNLPDFYINNAKIIRVVNVKTGGQKPVVIPYDRYLKELKGNAVLAKTVKYKNNYTNRKITKQGNDYKLSATRTPRSDKTGLPCYFIFTTTAKGWKIKEESMTTNVQTFLNAK